MDLMKEVLSICMGTPRLWLVVGIMIALLALRSLARQPKEPASSRANFRAWSNGQR